MKPVKTVVGAIVMLLTFRILRHVPGGKNTEVITLVLPPHVPQGIIWKTVHAKRVTVAILQIPV